MKLLALSAGENSGVLARISGALSGFTQEDTAFSTFLSLKAMLPDFAVAIKSAQLTVLAIDKAQYNAVRTRVCAALSLEMAQNEEIYGLLSERTGLSHEEKLKNAVVPKDAQVFLSEDGIYPGFAVQKGAQSILFLPLDSERIDRILKNGVVPYLLRREVRQEAPIPNKSTEPTVPVAQPDSPWADVLQRTLNTLRESGSRVAVSSTPAVQMLKTMGSAHADFEEFFVFTPHVEDKGDYNMTDYAALTAKSARELAKTQLGACISEITNGDSGDFIYITVADAKTAVVRKLYRETQESDADFMQDATEELIVLISEKASGKGAVGIEVAGVSTQEGKGFLSTKSGKITVAILAVLLIAAIALGCAFFAREAKKPKEPNTTTPIVTDPPTADQTPVTVETVPLSQFIYQEMRNGIQETPAEVTTENPSGTAIDTSGTNTNTGSDIPDTMLVNGRKMDAKEAVAKIMQVEVNETLNEEALKAQAVATYTYLKYRNTNWKITGVTLADAYSDEVYNAVRAVFGEYLAFGNAPAFTPFFRLSAGRTTAADAVYGQNFPYLRAVDSIADKTQSGYKTELIFSAADMRNVFLAYDSALVLDEDPNNWLQIVRHDGAVNVGVGYVETVSVGGKEISGIDFIEKVMKGKNLPSQCFSVTYEAATDEFTFEIYGIGYGVGMSQLGADKMAATGARYAEILAKFYSGTQLTA